MARLTKAENDARDRRVLLVLHLSEHPPTLREITMAADIGTKQAVHERLRRLTGRGLVYGGPLRPKTYVLTNRGQELAETFIDSGVYEE